MKIMTKNIVLKMLTGVSVTVLTVAGVAVPMTIGSNQNTADVAVETTVGIKNDVNEVVAAIEDSAGDVIVVEAASEAVVPNNDEENVVAEQGTKELVVASAEKTVASDKQNSGKQVDANLKTADTSKEQAKETVKEQTENIVVEEQNNNTVVKEYIANTENTENNNNDNNENSAVTQTAVEQTVTELPVTEQPQPVVEQPVVEEPAVEETSDDVDEQAYGIGGSDPVIGHSESRLVFEIPADEEPVDDDCVIAHRYCSCGASFEFRKISGIDGSWMSHVKEHAARGESIRWNDN